MDEDLEFLKIALEDVTKKEIIKNLEETGQEDLCSLLAGLGGEKDVSYETGLLAAYFIDGLLPSHLMKKIYGHLENCYLCNEAYRDWKSVEREFRKSLKKEQERRFSKFEYNLFNKIEENQLRRIASGEVTKEIEARIYFGFGELSRRFAANGFNTIGKAKEYYQRAANLGHSKAMQKLKELTTEDF